MSFFKVASADLTNTPFLKKIAAKQKPVVLSTGASTLPEIDEAVQSLEQYGCPSIILLHCILNYPTPIENAHINMIKGLGRAFPNYIIGYSDHTLPDESMTLCLQLGYLVPLCWRNTSLTTKACQAMTTIIRWTSKTY